MRVLACVVAAAMGGILGALAVVEASDPGPATEPVQIEAEGIENLFRLGPGLYSGGDPQGDAGFEALRRLGVRTIISVDGAAPDVETARRHGIRYVHLPIGYDGVPHDQAWRLILAARTLPGPLFVHCHHGKHRGPAAAAVCAMAVQGWTPAEALRWLEAAGTAPEYTGLYESVASFAPPTPAELASVAGELPERAPVPALVEAMVQVDARFDGLKALRAAGFLTPANRPDLDPPHEALQLREALRESARLPESQARGAEFLAALTEAEQAAAALEAALRAVGDNGSPAVRERTDAAFRRVERDCASCHARFRN